MDYVRGIRPGVLFVQGPSATVYPYSGEDDIGDTPPTSSSATEAVGSESKIGCTVVDQRQGLTQQQKRDQVRMGLRLRKKASAAHGTVSKYAGVSKATGSGASNTVPEVPFWQRVTRMPFKALSSNQRPKDGHQA